MARKHHPMPLSGGDRKALTKELKKSRAMTNIFAERSAEKRSTGEALIREADDLACQSWNERMWSDGGPVNPSPTIDQAINGGHSWLEIECSRCKAKRDVAWLHSATCQRRACMILSDGWCVRNARRPGSVPPRHFSSLCGASSIDRMTKSDFFVASMSVPEVDWKSRRMFETSE